MTTLATEEPFSASVESALLQNVCHACFNYSDGGKLKRCSRCSVVHYCSVKCQQRDWQDHSVECKCLRNYSPRIPNSFVRLIARFLFKSLSQGESFVAFNARRCTDLQDNCEKLVSSQRHIEHFSSLFNILLKYTHGVNLAASRAELFSAYGKIVTNAFAITSASGRVLGTGLYVGISVHDHSCVPDAFVYFEGSTAVMRSLQAGTSYDISLTISYVDLIHTTDERNKIFRDQFCFTCTCPSCSDNAEDQWKMSVNTTCCAGGLCIVDPSSDWNAEPPTCVLCKNEVVLKLGEVLDYNLRAKLELEAGTRIHFQSPDEEFNHWLSVYEKFAKVLSPYNTTLVAITQNLLLAAESIGRTDILQKCTGSTLSAYKRYLPLGHPELTQRLRSASVIGAGVSCDDFRNLLEEAYESAILSHGEDHPLSKELAALLFESTSVYTPANS